MFQKTIVNKFLKTQNTKILNEKWEIYKAHFHHSDIQENIRNSKEEQYQGEFLIDLFVNVLGYTKNPTPNFNLTTEYKNVKDSKKADGAIIIKDAVVAIIELKGTNTTDLSKIEDQAFGYKNNQPDCQYVITSNFEKLRFYIDNAIEHIEFNLFELTKDQFDLLYLCLAFENICNQIPAQLKAESVSQEDTITKKLYKDYSVFKRELFQDLGKQNPDFDPLELFKKSQKLLDRLLFLFFGEDRGLLPPNSVRMILEQWNKLKDLDEYVPLYDRFKKYFGYLNTGFKGKHFDVFAYNGGLFKPDEILDAVTIDDELLYHHTKKLAEYDFASEVDVNILGHIFENSLNELDEIKAQLAGEEIDKTKTKRKKDGVFYTPKYITKYIVENTVGKLCDEKKIALEIVEEDYCSDKKRQLKTKQALLQKLDQYRNWLHQLTIVDPACGSGAFLNEALNFLISEHQYIDELEAKLTGSSIAFTYHSESILENNLYGVDLNEESVEIAKLSLWLRTAEPNRKLNDLNSNIKCGNSLIDDPEVAGDKAFSWEKEFPKIFKEKKAYHVVFTTHNSRISQRMMNLGIVPGKPAELCLPQEIKLAKIFSGIVKDYDLEILAWNVCKDHVHIVLVCTEDELTHQVRLMKSISSKQMNRWMNPDAESSEDESASHCTPMGLDPLHCSRHRDALEKRTALEKSDFDYYQPQEHNNHLWSQKFFSVDTESWRWISDQESGFPYVATHLSNALAYIESNRQKHQLEDSQELRDIIAGFVKTPEQVFAKPYKGGFDVVIGNPPYGAKLDSTTQNYLNKKYIKGGSETVISFTKLAYDLLLKKHGEFGFIIPKSFTFSSNYQSIRNYVLNDINKIIDCKKVWKEVLLEQIIFFFKKENKCDDYISGILKENIIYELGKISKTTFDEFGFYLNGISEDELLIGQKLNKSLFYIKDIARNSRGGIFQNKISDNGNLNVLGGAEIQREGIVGIKGKIDFELIKEDEKCFIKENSILVQNLVAHIENPTSHIKITACIPDKLDYAIVDTINQITFNSDYNAKVFWCLFNSKLINWYSYRFIFAKAIRTMHFDNSITNRIPIPKDFNQQPFIAKADQMLSLNKELQEISAKFQRTLQREFGIEKPSKKLEAWHELSYADFLKELKKLKVELSLGQKAEWEDYFLQEQSKAQEIQRQIQQTDKEIDQMVYALYGLTEEEIEIVEKS